MDRWHRAASPFSDSIHSEERVAMSAKASDHDGYQKQNGEERQGQFLAHWVAFRNLN